MRALVIAVMMATALGGVAAADQPMEPRAQAPVAQHGRLESPTIDPARVPGDEPVVDPDRGTRRPSGYWTGYRPARGGAYKWSLMVVGLGVLALTIAALLFGLRRVGRNRDRARAVPRPTS
jgi:hypothetical protein